MRARAHNGPSRPFKTADTWMGESVLALRGDWGQLLPPALHVVHVQLLDAPVTSNLSPFLATPSEPEIQRSKIIWQLTCRYPWL